MKMDEYLGYRSDEKTRFAPKLPRVLFLELGKEGGLYFGLLTLLKYMDAHDIKKSEQIKNM